MKYKQSMDAAIAQAMREIPLIGWYGATENSARQYGVSLPELQREVDLRRNIGAK
jgi:hypothetical protein